MRIMRKAVTQGDRATQRAGTRTINRRPESLDENALAIGVFAGLGGGLAEVAWIAAYSSAVGSDPLAVASGITASVAPAAAGYSTAPLIGLAIHFLLSAVLGVAFAVAMYRWVPAGLRRGATTGFAVIALVTIWVMNFFVVLPILHSHFVTLLPLPVTLASKLLFGLVLGGITQVCAIVLPPSLGARAGGMPA